ncbi:MAG: hypothetical protein IT447_16905 [Phycisphaerales bacterium]|nr:hypothetical protein [Phycisphaerales bacterium]
MLDSLLAESARYWGAYQQLPLMTQWAVTLLIVAGIIVHVFTYGERVVHDSPSLFTNAGIFLTFLGIAEGLYDFNAQSRSRKSAQDDKWNFCLTAGTL